jgi:hypothetical protein
LKKVTNCSSHSQNIGLMIRSSLTSERASCAMIHAKCVHMRWGPSNGQADRRRKMPQVQKHRVLSDKKSPNPIPLSLLERKCSHASEILILQLDEPQDLKKHKNQKREKNPEDHEETKIFMDLQPKSLEQLKVLEDQEEEIKKRERSQWEAYLAEQSPYQHIQRTLKIFETEINKNFVTWSDARQKQRDIMR